MADEWVWLMTDFFPYLDGKYSAGKLLTQIAEHRLLTTRLVLFIDAIFFDLRGLFPSTVTYLSLAGIAFMLARLAVQPTTVPVQAAAFIVLLAITWSISQYFNLTWSYQVQFPLVHLFALGALWSFAIAVTTEDNVRYAWLVLALICDFFSIWSAGSGIFLTASFVLIAIWLGLNRVVAIFFLIHLLMVTHFLADYNLAATHRELHGFPGWGQYRERMVRYVGWPFLWWSYQAARIAALVGVAAFLFLTTVVTVKSLVGRVVSDRNLCVLLAFATFALIEGLLLGYTRRTVLARHSTMPIMFATAILAALWRFVDRSRAGGLRWAVLGLAMLTICLSNQEKFEREWRSRTAWLDTTIAAARAGEFPAEQMCRLTRHGWLIDAMNKLKKNSLGPYAEPLIYPPPLSFGAYSLPAFSKAVSPSNPRKAQTLHRCESPAGGGQKGDRSAGR